MSFYKFAQAHGLIIDQVIEGRWVRTKTTDKPGRRNGAYKFMGDVGFVQNHATMDEVAVWRPDKPISPDEALRISKESRERRRREARLQAEAVRAMREHWNSLPPLIGEHPYLVRKQLSMMGCKGLRLDGDLITIPVYRQGQIISLQTIAPDGTKKYRYKCPTKGGAYTLRRPGAVVTCLAEGFATGLAIYQTLTNANVIVCFSDGNLVTVAKELKVTGMAVVCADNDWETKNKIGRNPGIERATEAAQAIGCGIAYPEGIFGTDWADALVEWGEAGPGKLRTEIMRGARPIFKS